MGSTGNGNDGWLVARGRQVAPFDKHDTTRLQRVFHPLHHFTHNSILQESALFAIHVHSHTHTLAFTHVVTGRFIMSIEIANCDFS